MGDGYGHTVSNLTLKEIHDKYLGAEDKYSPEEVAKFNVPKHDGIVKETRTFIFDSTPDSGRRFFKHMISGSYDWVDKDGVKPYAKYKGEAYTNFKITPSSAIDRIEFMIGGMLINMCRLYRLLNKDIELDEMSGERAIPALAHHSNEIIFETDRECQVSLSYDVVTQVHTENVEEMTENMLYCEQFTGPEDVSDMKPYRTEVPCIPGMCKIGLYFHHPIVSLYAFLPETTIDARLILDSVDYGLILTKTEAGYYHIEFGDETSINFSRVDRLPELQITLSETNFNYERGASVVAINKSVIRRMDGMAGLAFIS
jgi:hypothetical protein